MMNMTTDKRKSLSISSWDSLEIQNRDGQVTEEIMKRMCVSLYLHMHPFLWKDDAYRLRYLEKIKSIVIKYSSDDAFSIAWLNNYQAPFCGGMQSERCQLYRFSWNKGKLVKKKDVSVKGKKEMLYRYRYTFIVDCLFLCAFMDEKKGLTVLSELKTSFCNCHHARLDMLFSILYHDEPLSGDMWVIADLVDCWRENAEFFRKIPMNILVTANMSAGKSTFINALVGKNISLSQNMACTSKIHSIFSKPYEDGYVYEYDYDLVTDAGKEELLRDNERNLSDWLSVGTYYNSVLGGSRLIIHDSPGVNYSDDSRHRETTAQWIKKNNYELLIYVMDATQLRTMDEKTHLEFVRDNVGECPILFVINKIDGFNIEEESVEEALRAQKKYLEDIGFKNPVLCPVSSRAAYLAKKFMAERLTKGEAKELDNLIFKFEEMNLPQYYNEFFPEIRIPDRKKEEMQLLKNSGMLYIERIILQIYDGGKGNDAGLC